MKPKEIRFDIRGDIYIDRETADFALKLVEFYVNRTKKKVYVTCNEYGKVGLSYEPEAI